MTTATELLAEIEGRLSVAHLEIGDVAVDVRNRWRMSIPARPDYDTDLIISRALDDGEKATSALRAVLALHEEVEVWAFDDVNGAWVTDDDGEKIPLPPVCRECTPHDSLLAIEDCEWSDDYETVPYPCPTVTAITTALSASEAGL